MAEFSTHSTCGGLLVLGTDRSRHIIRSDVQGGKFDRIHPDTHGVVSFPHDADLTDTVHTRQGVTDVGSDVVGKLHLIQLAAVGGKVVKRQNITGTLEVFHTVIFNDLRQKRFRTAHSVLDIHQSDIGVGTGFEGDGKVVETCVT